MTELDPRKQEILKTVIHTYIHAAEPVGSETVAQRVRPGVSPATVRHEMAALEDLGFLFHPHTSAGRVPTDRGYRFYVDAMLPQVDLTPRERARVRRQFKVIVEEQAPVLEGIARTMARATEYASVAAEPHPATQVFAHLHFIALASNILKQPEFQDARAAQPVLSALEREDVVADLLRGTLERPVWITIGSEHRHEDLRGCAVVAAAYQAGGKAVGALGIVGPTRMDYARVISLVRTLAADLSDALERS